MSTTTQEQKDIQAIKEDILSIRKHLSNIKDRQDNEDMHRIETNKKLDFILNALTDNDFNSKNGYLTRLNKMEAMIILHDLYWKILFSILLGGGVIAGVIKLITK